MSVAKREEEVKDPNINIEEIKKKNEEKEFEDEINRVMDKVSSYDSEDYDPEEFKLIKELQNSVKCITEALGITSKRTKKAKESSSALMDPLELTEEIIRNYQKFLDYMIQMLKKGGKDEKVLWERWFTILQKGEELGEAMIPRLERISHEMGRMKNDEKLQREYLSRSVLVHDLLAQLEDINTRLEYSPNINLVSYVNFTEYVLPSCLRELKLAKENLSEALEKSNNSRK